MENVTDRVSNPFGFSAGDGDQAIFGWGDANADVHVIGDHPGRHGGIETGIPFTGQAASERLRGVLQTVGLLTGSNDGPPEATGVYMSYLHPTVLENAPSPRSYADQERFLDAEVRAITAHVLVPVGDRAVEYVLRYYTAEKVDTRSLDQLHATERGTGAFLVVPVKDPADWSDADEQALIDRLQAILTRDFRRESDLGRFLPGGDPYFVR